jgi:ubiquitin-protein ligase
MYQMDPVIRMKRLQADHAAMIELQRSSHLISFRAQGSPPDRYLVTYRCKGTVLEGTKVTISTRHTVEIILHANYPSAAPKFRLRTPLFHPNFKHGDPNLQVCIEARNWTPREPLDDLVLRIGNMITYRNYNPGNPLDAVAARWASENKHYFPLDDRPWITPADHLVEILETGAHREEPISEGADAPSDAEDFSR